MSSNVRLKNMKILINISIAIIVPLFLLPIWLMAPKGATIIPTLQIIIDLIIIPCALSILNIKSYLAGKIRKYLSAYLITLFCAVVAQVIGYCNWGISTGNLFNPDGETIYLTKSFIIASLVLTSFIFLIGKLSIKRKSTI